MSLYFTCFQINKLLGKIDLTRDGLKVIGDEEPSLFCTWEFFEYETQATPVVKSSK